MTCAFSFRVHRNPVLLFPGRHGGLDGAALAVSPLDRAGVQAALHKVVDVVDACGLKKITPHSLRHYLPFLTMSCPVVSS